VGAHEDTSEEDNAKNNGGGKKKKKEKPKPKIKRKKSKAKRLLHEDIQEGRVPGEVKDMDGKRTANLKGIYNL
jgi:hypothetical protein